MENRYGMVEYRWPGRCKYTFDRDFFLEDLKLAS